MTIPATSSFSAHVAEARSERRRYGRIELDEPIAAELGVLPVRVEEVSATGFLVSHEGRVTPGETRPLVIRWNGGIHLQSTIVRSTLFRLGSRLGDMSVFHSGIRIVRTPDDDYEKLRHMIGERIVRALNEQKANARGIPPLLAYLYQPEKGDLYRRCESLDGRWRKTETIHPEQPPHGFTVSARVDPHHLDLLCEAWEQTTPEGRRLMQLLAQLSTSPREGGPVRRYVP